MLFAQNTSFLTAKFGVEKTVNMLADAGFPREAIYICAYANSVEGYLAPAAEFPYGGYEVINAAAWYNTSRTCTESEGAVLAWFAQQVQNS